MTTARNTISHFQSSWTYRRCSWTLETGLREIAKIRKGTFRLTANQHILVLDIADEDLNQIEDTDWIASSFQENGLRHNIVIRIMP